METAPIFIIGTERSGSNLLRLILNSHSGIAVPHPPHILKFFAPLEASYGDLTRPAAMAQLVADVLGLLDAHIYPWETAIDQGQILAASPPTLVGLFFTIYDHYRAHQGKRRWGCKSTFVIHHWQRILAACPEARFILLVRDPRDVAVSSRRSIFSPFHPWFTARLWRAQQLAGLKLLAAAPGNVLVLRYEDLIAAPTRAVPELCRFLNETYEPGMLAFHQTRAARKSSALSSSWHNVGSPIRADNRQTYRTGLSSNELRLVEGVCGDLLTHFGYPLELAPQGPPWPAAAPAPWQRLGYWLLDWWWRIKTEIHSLGHDRNYRLHWQRRLFLLRLRLRRRLATVGR
jgi:hypothetical protein